MLAIVSSEAMREAERNAGVSEGELMHRAALGIADWLERNVISASERPRVVAAAAGPGNNGGDALCVLAILAERGWSALALPVLRDEAGDLPVDANSLARIEWVSNAASLRRADVILDGIFGNGARPELPDEVRAATTEINSIRSELRTPVVAVDVPTGIDSDSGDADDGAIQADVTLGIALPKQGLLREPAASAAGDLEILDIGIPEPETQTGPWLATAKHARSLISRRPASAHKHEVGGVLVIGGAPTYYGAPRLAGNAALRAGAGYAGLAVPRSVVGSIATGVPELVFHPLSDGDGRRSADQIRTAIEETGSRYRSVVLGPGIGRDEVADELLASLLAGAQPVSTDEHDPAVGFGIPRRGSVQPPGEAAHHAFENRSLVLDADALYWLSEQPEWIPLLHDLNAVLTPHAGELARLRGMDVDEVKLRPVETASETARESGQVVVLKYGYSCACAPDGRVVHAPRSTPELATPGSGDVLAGMIGALLAQGLDTFDAAAVGLYIGAMGGRHARRELGTRAVTASDLIASLPVVVRGLTEPSWHREDT